MCSALKSEHRKALAIGLSNVDCFFLEGDFDVIAQCVRERSTQTTQTTNYMPESLLQSQFEALERPDRAQV
jgi:gluconate kinase